MELKVDNESDSDKEINSIVERMTARYTEQYHNKEITKEDLDEMLGYLHLWAERKKQARLQ